MGAASNQFKMLPPATAPTDRDIIGIVRSSASSATLLDGEAAGGPQSVATVIRVE